MIVTVISCAVLIHIVAGAGDDTRAATHKHSHLHSEARLHSTAVVPSAAAVVSVLIIDRERWEWLGGSLRVGGGETPCVISLLNVITEDKQYNSAL